METDGNDRLDDSGGFCKPGVAGSSPVSSTAPHVTTCATLPLVGSSISVRDLRNTVSEVLRRVEGGERLTVTVDRRPVAEIVPLRRRRTVPWAEALVIASRHAADRGLLEDVRGLLSDTTDDV